MSRRPFQQLDANVDISNRRPSNISEYAWSFVGDYDWCMTGATPIKQHEADYSDCEAVTPRADRFTSFPQPPPCAPMKTTMEKKTPCVKTEKKKCPLAPKVKKVKSTLRRL